MELYIVAFVFYFLAVPLTSAAFEATNTEHEVLLFHRAKKVMELIKTRTCRELTAGQNCTILRQRSSEQMNFYMAAKSSALSSLNMNIPLRPRPYDLYKNMDAVVIVDPMPDAHFGHAIIVALIKLGISRENCANRRGLYYRSPVSDSQPECMYLPLNTGKCLIEAQLGNPRINLRRSCSFDFIPFVYDINNVAKQQLKCYDTTIPKFGKCPKTDGIDNPRCRNRPCSNEPKNPRKIKSPVCNWSCDYALLVSGGWSKYTNRIRHLHNVQDMFQHLNVRRGFLKQNIKVFFANNATIELDGDSRAKETVPAVDASTIQRHVTRVCSKDTKCIDTLVIYLNGPTTKNGDLLLWDWNEDGTASNAEILSIQELLQPLEDCNAKNFLIVADQNFAGHIIDHVQQGRSMGKNNYQKIHVLTASNKGSYSWRRDFTKLFIQFDSNQMDEDGDAQQDATLARRISSIAQDLKKAPLLKRYKMHYLEGSNKDLTLTGDYGQLAGCVEEKGD